ncbi:MAG: HXXEE domain-containing protein [Chthoniobacterales bacterium]
MLAVLQALHSAEEFIFKFYAVFPPMAFLYRQAPQLAKPAFVVFNVLLLIASLICWSRWVRPARHGARAVVWVWIGAEAFNAVVHLAWAVVSQAYNPGLVTGLGFVPIVAYLAYLLRCAPTYAAA